jgi:predicted nucleic acid-binding protein
MKLVFDTSVLSCFARAGLLDLLEKLTRGYERVVPRAVRVEIANGVADHPQLAEVAGCDWLVEVPVDSLKELVAFAYYSSRLGAGEHHVGESSALAWAEINGGRVVVDDQDAVQCAKEKHLEVSRSLALIVTGIRKGVLDEAQAAEAIDALISLGGARFPTDGAGFLAWARDKGLL